MSKFIIGLVSLVFIVAIVHFVAQYRFKNLANDLIAQVTAETAPTLVKTEIPQSILTFVERAGVKPENLAKTIKLSQIAEMRLDKGGDWQGLTASQTISTGAMGFVWFADQKMGPITKFRVIDAFVAGEGRLNVRVLGSIPIANATGPEVNIAEAMRYLGELVWAPDAMIGQAGLNWQEQDNGDVTVSIELPDGIAATTFIFNDDGDIVEVRAKDRPAETVDGKIMQHDWLIKVGGYKLFDGRRVATTAEVGYVYDDGYEAYWRGEVVSYSAKAQ